MTAPALDKFQLDTLAFIDRAGGRAVIADPMGARKTGTTLYWLAGSGDRRVLVVAPSAVHRHWFREADRFWPAAMHHHGAGTKEKRLNHLAACKADETWPELYVTTYESMKADQLTIEKVPWDCVVFDEGHKLKGRTNQVALCSNAVTKKPAHLLIVTGTPVLNHASELWQYLHLLDPKTYGTTGNGRFWKWAEAHYKVEIVRFRNARWPTKIIHGFRPGQEEVVRSQIAPYFIQRDIASLFPDAAWSAAERKLYENLVKFKWGIAGGTEVTTQNSLDLTTRLNQIASDWGTLDETLDAGTKVKATIELTRELLERDEPVVIFAKYKATVHRIVRELVSHDIKACAYTGDVPADTRDRDVQAFNAVVLNVLVGTLDALSEGVDGLQHTASNVIMVDRHWTPAKNDQAIGRLRRSGQLKRVTVWHVFAEKTIDATITAACLRKTNVIQVLRGMPLVDAIYGRV